MVDFTGVIQFRGAAEMGGLYFAFNMVRATPYPRGIHLAVTLTFSIYPPPPSPLPPSPGDGDVGVLRRHTYVL
jgi:hypothetical protein